MNNLPCSVKIIHPPSDQPAHRSTHQQILELAAHRSVAVYIIMAFHGIGAIRRRTVAKERVADSIKPEPQGRLQLHVRHKRTASSSLDWGVLIFAAIVFPLGLLSFFLGRHNNGNIIEDLLYRSSSRNAKGTSTSTAGLDHQSAYHPKYGEAVLGYDIHNCPAIIPPDYPKTWNSTEILRSWNPNDVTTIPREVYQGLCVFDYETQHDVATIYRDADMPFVIRGDPKVLAVVKRWSNPNHLLDHLSNQMIYTERSPNNHIKYFRIDPESDVDHWTRPPNDIVMMSFEEWLDLALLREATVLNDMEIMNEVIELRKRDLDRRKMDGGEVANVAFPEDDAVELKVDLDTEEEKRLKWYYLRLNGWVEDANQKKIDKFLFDEISFFDPRRKQDHSEFYLVPAEEQNGINCRFGMRGIVAEAHYDGTRNMLAILEGERRYILGHPNQCKDTYGVASVGTPKRAAQLRLVESCRVGHTSGVQGGAIIGGCFGGWGCVVLAGIMVSLYHKSVEEYSV